MGDETRRFVYNRQEGLCQICGERLDGQFILHHIRNRANNGPSIASNLAARHTWCEAYAHKTYKSGNPTNVFFEGEYHKPRKSKQLKLRSDKRQIDMFRMIADESYCWKQYCKGGKK